MANTNSLRPGMDRNPLRSGDADYSPGSQNYIEKGEEWERLTTPLTEGKEMPPVFIEEKVDTEADHPGMVKNPEYVKVMKHLEDVLDVVTL